MIAFVLLVVCVGACIGQTVDPSHLHAGVQRLFDNEDKNADGFLTKLEMYAHMLSYDHNNDGKLSRHEFTEEICTETPRLYPVSHYMYDLYDLNHDHFIDTPDIDIFFPRVDTNNDGKIDFNEYLAMAQKAVQQLHSLGTHHQSHAHGHSQCH